MDGDENHAKKTRLLEMWKYIASFAVGVVITAFALGQRGQKMAELYEWKAEVTPKIQRMDSEGTISFELFHKEYEKTQTRQEAQIKELERTLYDERIKELKERIQTLERK